MRLVLAVATATLVCGPASAKMLGILKDNAKATIIDSQGRPIGKAEVVASKKHGLRFKLSVKGMPKGEHGIHIHDVGVCEGPKFTSAGPHWNPLNRQHGRDNPDGSHAGDLPNLLIKKNGRGSLKFDIAEARFDKERGMMDANGAAIVIHAMSDDHRTDPTGNSGDRIACGIFVKDKGL